MVDWFHCVKKVSFAHAGTWTRKKLLKEKTFFLKKDLFNKTLLNIICFYLLFSLLLVLIISHCINTNSVGKWGAEIEKKISARPTSPNPSKIRYFFILLSSDREFFNISLHTQANIQTNTHMHTCVCMCVCEWSSTRKFVEFDLLEFFGNTLTVLALLKLSLIFLVEIYNLYV